MDGTATNQGHDSSEYDNHGEEDRHGREDFYEGLLHSEFLVPAAIDGYRVTSEDAHLRGGQGGRSSDLAETYM